MGNEVKQQPPPEGEMLSQLPPLLVAALALKRALVLSLVGMLMTCGRGFAPPNDMTKLMGFT